MNKMKRSYPLKVWLTTLMLGNFLYSGVFIVHTKNIAIDISVSIFAVFLGSIILSLPAFLINVLLYRLVSEGNLKNRWAQTVVASIGLGLIGLTFLPIVYTSAVVNGEDPVELYLAAGCYMTVSVVAAFYFRLQAAFPNKTELPASA